MIKLDFTKKSTLINIKIIIVHKKSTIEINGSSTF